MSLKKLQSFVKKISRVLYYNTLYTKDVFLAPSKVMPEEALPSELTPNQRALMKIDPIAQIIPLCIDYILEYEMAEEKSLAEIL